MKVRIWSGRKLSDRRRKDRDYWADRIRSDKRKADLHLTIHFIQWEIEFQSRTSGWRIRMLDCFEFYIFTPDYVLGVSVDYDRNIQDIFLRDRAADIKQEMA